MGILREIYPKQGREPKLPDLKKKEARVRLMRLRTIEKILRVLILEKEI